MALSKKTRVFLMSENSMLKYKMEDENTRKLGSYDDINIERETKALCFCC